MFLTETDSTFIEKDDDYKIAGFKTILPLIKNVGDKVRIMCLLNNAKHYIMQKRP